MTSPWHDDEDDDVDGDLFELPPLFLAALFIVVMVWALTS